MRQLIFIDDFRRHIYIIGIEYHISVKFRFHIVHCRWRNGICKQCCRIVWCKRIYYILISVDEIENKRLFLKRRTDTIQSRQRLYGIHAAQFFQNVHCTKFGLIKARLILVCNKQNVVIVGIESFGQFIFRKPFNNVSVYSVSSPSSLTFRKCHESVNSVIALLCDIIFKCLTILHRTCA